MGSMLFEPLLSRLTWRPEQALLMPIILTCISAATASQNVMNCRQCYTYWPTNTKHHCGTACDSNPFATPTQNNMLSVQKPFMECCIIVPHVKPLHMLKQYTYI